MKIAKAHVKSVSPYSQARFIERTNDAQLSRFERDVLLWRQRMYVSGEGNVYIPGRSIKLAMLEACKHFNAGEASKFDLGVQYPSCLDLGIKADSVKGEIMCSSGGSMKLATTFPIIPNWEGVIEFGVYHNTVTEGEFENCLKVAGNYIGVGRFRPRTCGTYGRFEVLGVDWSTAT